MTSAEPEAPLPSSSRSLGPYCSNTVTFPWGEDADNKNTIIVTRPYDAALADEIGDVSKLKCKEGVRLVRSM